MAHVRRSGSATATLPERLRSALTARGWVRRPGAARPLRAAGAAGRWVRSGRLIAEAAASFVVSAQALPCGRTAHASRRDRPTIGGRLDWFPRDASPAWQGALHGLDELVAVGIAGAHRDRRRTSAARWYELAIGDRA